VKRAAILAALVIAVLGAALPYAPVDFVKAPMERALARGLGRKVEVDHVSLTLFSGPGFSFDGVTIHEDPRAGIEPFAYANTLDATMDLLALLRGRVEFSSLHFNDATFNLVKPDDGPWNFQMLLSAAGAARLPAFKMRGGRVNFKFGQSKSVLFFDDTDLDVSRGDAGVMDLRFSGAPARTDRSTQSFGHFFVRGSSTPSPAGQQLNFRIELEPSALDSVARLFTPGGAALKGVVSLDAQVAGAPAHLDVKGTVQLAGGGNWRLGYQGALDLIGQTLELEAISPQDLHAMLRVSARNLLSRPQWDLSADLADVPLAAAADVARKLGAPLPEKLPAEGTMAGTVRYSNTGGLSGNVEMRDVIVNLANSGVESDTMNIPTATVFLKGATILAGPVTVGFGEKESAEVQATYQAGDGGGLEVKVATRRMSMNRVRALGITGVPLLDRVTDGAWRGALKYQKPAAEPGVWSGDFEVLNTQIAVDGLAAPVRLQSAAVSAKPEYVAVTRMKAKAGGIDFSGDYRWDADAAQPQKFRLRVAAADLKELERLFRPTLSRPGGILARTLRLGAGEAAPEWLAQRKAEGTLALQTLNAGDVTLTGTARLTWDGAAVKLTAINGKIGDAQVAGELRVDLSASVPQYRFEGRVEDLAYKGGKLDFDGRVEAAGSGLALLASVTAEGALRGRSIALSADSEYRRVSGRFAMSMTPAGPQWKLSDLELLQGTDTLSGEAVSQADGKLVLKLNRGQ
jgi:hypothetical protein